MSLRLPNRAEWVRGVDNDVMSDRGSRIAVHLPFALVVLIALIGFVRVAGQHWREGAMLVGGALVLAALLRAVLSPQQAGLLAVRSRPVDIMLCSGFGILIIWVAITIHGFLGS